MANRSAGAWLALAVAIAAGCSDDTKPQPDGPRRDLTRIDGARGDLAGQDAAVLDLARPDTAKPDTAKPDAPKPDMAKPDATKPDATKPDATKSDTAKPDTVSCSDGKQNGTETDVDCGGTCPKCVDGKKCSVGTDCTSKLCTGSVCQVPSCTDAVQNGSETDLNCGGTCPKCVDGKKCAVGTDCTSKVCTGSICQVPSCTDAAQNGTETDLNCGGTCPKCAIGKSCGVSGDCLHGICASTKCRVPLRCAELHTAHPTLPSGSYTLDPDGTGTIAPFTAYCEMTTDGGGWTRVAGIANDLAHVDNGAVNAAGLTTATAVGKLSDAVINLLKSGASPAFRLRCRAVVGYFPTGCTFNATTDATGACTSQAYTYPPSAYGTTQSTQSCIAGLADGDSGTSDRLIYGPSNCGCCSGCDTAADGWGGTGELWVR